MKKLDWDILVNHLTGTSSESEEKKLAVWLAEKRENQVLYDRIRRLWSASPQTGRRPDTEQALKLVLSRIQQAETSRGATITSIPTSRPAKHPPRFVTTAYAWRIAAVLVLFVGAFVSYRIFVSGPGAERASVTFSSMQSLQLPDGTKATFDVGSTFTYPKTFGDGGGREVSLTGEAYFEVARDEKRPFIIHAEGGRIEVLGTKFDVRAWRTDRHITVAVKEGRVSFQSEDNRNEQNVVFLTENSMSSLIPGATPTPAEHIDFAGTLSWMKKEIYFRNAPVPEVLHQLERWYGVTILSSDSTFLNSNITIFIENKPLIDNLNLISVTMNVRHEQTGNMVRFIPN